MNYLFKKFKISLKNWFRKPLVTHFNWLTSTQKGRGFFSKGQEFVHHSDIPYEETAFYNLAEKQKIFILAILVIFMSALVLNWHLTLVLVLGIFTVLYFIDLLFSLFLIVRSFQKKPEITVREKELLALSDADLPLYTIFCPLYKEGRVVKQFCHAILKLDYPKDKLQILFLLEEDDLQTLSAIRELALPSNFQVVVVPNSKPKTKPKAMNYGLKFALGKYLVVYDAEDVPDTRQLKKAVAAFSKASSDLVCIQAKLNFYNPRQNLLTKIFTAEYSLWFDLVLTGLQSINAPIPLGGTSNHFRTHQLKALGGWDAFNVTEDCDLGVRLSKKGYKTAIIDSTTLEEANSDLKNWYYQRSRWIKGYIQTYLVHTRSLREFLQSSQTRNLAVFQVVVGGKILSLFINPLMWLTTLAYFLFRAKVGPVIDSFFPPAVLYLGVFSLVFGNLMYLYSYMMGSAKRGDFGLIKYAFFVPFYWLFMSVAAWQAVYEVIVRPHYWAKTLHGLHIKSFSPDGRRLPIFSPSSVIQDDV